MSTPLKLNIVQTNDSLQSVKETCWYDEAVKLAPRFRQVRVLIHDEAEGYDLKAHLAREDHLKNQIEFLWALSNGIISWKFCSVGIEDKL